MAPMDRFTSICQRLCNGPCCTEVENELDSLGKRARDNVLPPGMKKEDAASAEKPKPQTQAQQIALKTVLEKEYPSTDPFAQRRKYQINMYLLFRLYIHKRFHKLIPGEMDDKARYSFNRLIGFTNSMICTGGRGARLLFRVGREGCLTELADYWRSLPDDQEMMKYKGIWEHVAQRPLAWEGLVRVESSRDNDEGPVKKMKILW